MSYHIYSFFPSSIHRDAADCVKYKHGSNYDGYILRVEFPRGDGARGRGGGGGGRAFGGPPSRRTNYRVLVSGWSIGKV